MRISTIAVLVLIAVGCSPQESADAQDAEIQSAIRTVVDADTSSNIRQFYEGRSYQGAWVEAGRAPDRLRTAIATLCAADAQGLNASDYLAPQFAQKVERAYGSETESDSVRVRRLAELDVAVSKRLMELAEDLIAGRVDPRSFGEMWQTPVHDVDPVAVLQKAAGQAGPAAIARQISETHDQYAALVAGLQRYRAIERSGGFPTVEAGAPLSPADSSVRVLSVRRRLVASGDLDSTASGDSSFVYTESLAEGVRSFQERHGLQVDGVVGESVVNAMNVPVEERISQIEINLERWRWIPVNLGGKYLYVNIPAFHLRAFENGEEVLQSKVVVGTEFDARSTPVFSDTMEYVVFNPYWNIPKGIAAEEILPEARSNPSYLAANDYEIVSGWGDGADVVSATQRNMGLVESGEYRLRQKPGPQNSLGRIKFMFPNDFDVYLHDTPAEHLFDRVDRAYSHGCIRVDKEIELAEYVFTDRSASQIEQIIASGEHQTENLANPLPVYILYWTSFADDDGRIYFRDDIYGHDEMLRSVLAEQAPKGPAVSCESLLSTVGDPSS